MIPSDNYMRKEGHYEKLIKNYLKKYGGVVCRIFPKDEERVYRTGIRSYEACRNYIRRQLSKRPGMPCEILINEDLGKRGGAIISEVKNGIPRIGLEDADDRRKVIYGTGRPDEIRRIWFSPYEALHFQRTDNVPTDFHRLAYDAMQFFKVSRGEFMPGYFEFFVTPWDGEIRFVEAVINPRLLKEMGILDAA